MSSFEHPIPAPRLITASSLPISAGNAANPKAEPAVELKVDTLPLIPIPGLPLVRAPIATSKTVPTSNDGFGNLPLDDVPGMGIVLPNGLNMYYLDIGPNSEGNLHRTTSTDYIVVLQGTLSLITPDGEFNLETGCKALKETLCHPGEVVYQRGIMHA
ncbi:hypothetical protein F5Y16DRAFT_146235 [Xylariaceae sp. FL0255]|nr:hypothetical protein F5Y16DRAFT_146235 [Xylariaceae sp. FL0255]